MYTDSLLRLATAETVPNAGAAPGGLGEDSTALDLDPGGFTEVLRNYSDIGPGEKLVLNFNIDTAFTCASIATLEFQLVSLPIQAALLDDGSGGAADGKLLTATVTSAADIVTLAGHDLPLGTPFLSGTVGASGLTTNTIYYAVPETANGFKVALSLAAAIAGTTETVAAGLTDITFIHTVHASTGGLALYPNPANSGPLSVAGRAFQMTLNPSVGPTPPLYLPTVNATTPISTQKKLPLGAGPEATIVAANAQRYYYLRYVPSATITAGAVTCDLVLDAGDSLRFHAVGQEVI